MVNDSAQLGEISTNQIVWAELTTVSIKTKHTDPIRGSRHGSVYRM